MSDGKPTISPGGTGAPAPRQAPAPAGNPRLRAGKGIDIEQNDFTRNMLTKMDVQYVILNNKMVVIGDPAFDLANIYNRETRRPMQDGMISPKEKDDAIPIEKLLIDRLLGPPKIKNEVCYFSIPADPIDAQM